MFKAIAVLTGVTVCGSPVASTAWNAIATVRQPVHSYETAPAAFVLPTVGPPT